MGKNVISPFRMSNRGVCVFVRIFLRNCFMDPVFQSAFIHIELQQRGPPHFHVWFLASSCVDHIHALA